MKAFLLAIKRRKKKSEWKLKNLRELHQPGIFFSLSFRRRREKKRPSASSQSNRRHKSRSDGVSGCTWVKHPWNFGRNLHPFSIRFYSPYSAEALLFSSLLSAQIIPYHSRITSHINGQTFHKNIPKCDVKGGKKQKWWKAESKITSILTMDNDVLYSRNLQESTKFLLYIRCNTRKKWNVFWTSQ